MKNFFEKQTLKKILLVLAVLFIIILAPITMPLMFLGGCFGIWRFSKRKPNIRKRNIAIAITIVGILGIYAVGKLTPDVIKEQTEQSQVTKFTSKSSSSSSSSSQTSSSTASSSKKEKQEKERKEKELQEAQKQKQEKRRRLRKLLRKPIRLSNSLKIIKLQKIFLQHKQLSNALQIQLQKLT